MSKALGDEKTAEWLEYNLSLIPECVEKMKSAAAARGSKLVSCSITINGYDSITSETCTRSEADPGTEKARKQLEERLENIKEEKKQRKGVQLRRQKKGVQQKRLLKNNWRQIWLSLETKLGFLKRHLFIQVRLLILEAISKVIVKSLRQNYGSYRSK